MLLAAYGLSAQAALAGRVVDATSGEGVPYVNLTVRERADVPPRAHTLTDATGAFRVAVVGLDSAYVITSGLGYRPDTLRTGLPGTGLRIVLRPVSLGLPAVTVAERRPDIVTRSDTVAYRLETFRDATDHKVEAVLRKLPGVEVSGDGAITVNGKPLHRLLVEGSDLFGADYQLSSRNINARDIGVVEVIDHFEDDPVLRDVNASEAIVLNLKLEEHVRALVAGDLGVGAGYGGGTRYTAAANVYRIDRVHKTIALGDLENVGEGAAYGGRGRRTIPGSVPAAPGEISEPLLRPLDIVVPPAVDQAGLARVYTDDGSQASGTVRHESRLTEDWTLRANLDGGLARRGQTIDRLQRYIGEGAAYALNYREDWTRRLAGGAGGTTLTYAPADGRVSFTGYAGAYRQPELALQYTRNAYTLRVRASGRYTAFGRARTPAPLTYALHVAYERRVTPSKTLRVSAETERAYPDARYFADSLRLPLDLFEVWVGPGLRPVRDRTVAGTVYYGARNNLRFTAWSGVLTVEHRSNVPNFRTAFAGDVQLRSWFFGGSRSRVQAVGRYSRFIAALKSNLTFRLGSGLSRVAYAIEARQLRQRYWSLTPGVEAGVLLFKRLRVKVDAAADLSRVLGQGLTFLTLRNQSEFLVTAGPWRLIGGISHVTTVRQRATRSFAGGFAGARYVHKVRGRELTLALSVYNLTNQRAFVTQDVGELYLYAQTVPAVPRFALLSVNVGL